MLRPEGDIPRKPNDFRWLRDISAAITYYVLCAAAHKT